jgi:ABC-type transport system involved in multi-copper enzyme maturation permease subunit
MILTQTTAFLVDAYRELNARKMFWITLGLSLLVVAVMGCFGVNDKGLTFLAWTFDNDILNSRFIPPEKFYKFVFANLGVPIWLTWAATILALISTASIFPDFIQGGSIELTLCRPIGRVRLFFTKFACGLLFVALQVFVFSLACFIVIGIRGKSWEPALFLAVPIVLLFFTYLFSFCTLVGLVTRSTLASILFTCLFWLALFVLNTTDGIFVSQRAAREIAVERADRTIEVRTRGAERMRQRLIDAGQPLPAKDAWPAGAESELEAISVPLLTARNERAEAVKSRDDWVKYSNWVFLAKTVLPKTSETIALLDRAILTDADRDLFSPPGAEDEPTPSEDDTGTSRRRGPQMGDPAVTKRAEKIFRERSQWWITGTSAVFAGTLLAFGAFIFRRRDF